MKAWFRTQEALYAGFGFVVFTLIMGIYWGGVMQGAKRAQAQCGKEKAKLTLEIDELNQKLIKKRAESVGSSAKEAADKVLKQQKGCALEVQRALKAAAQLMCEEITTTEEAE